MPPDPRTDAVLRAAVLAGDAGAWAAWLDTAYPRVERYVRWRCGGPGELADEVLQDAWLTAARTVRRFDPARADFAGWVCGVAANVLRNTLRGRRRRARRETPMAVEPACHRPEADEAVAVALANLPPHYERVLRAKYLDGATVAEVGKELGLGEAAAESLLARARQAFKAAYTAAGGDR
jgi:RNA polymerase sigma-70 factor (ECF subfamily)